MARYTIYCRVCKAQGEAYNPRMTTCNSCMDKGYKYCNKCHTIKDHNDFGTNNNNRYGLQTYCKRCQSAASGGTYAPPTYNCRVCKGKYTGARRTVTCPTCTSSGYRYCTSCEEVLVLEEFYFNTTRREYMNVCKACQVAKTGAVSRERYNHDQRYRDMIAGYKHKYRANLRGTYTVDEWIECVQAYDYSCAYCGTKHNITVDHIVAVSQGGWNYAFNLVPACHSCNSSKGAKDVVEWYTAQPFYSEERLRNIHKRYRMKQQELLKGGEVK